MELRLGAPAPPLLTGASVEAAALASLDDQPVVVAFLSNWDHRFCPEEDLEAVRGELRGLGAVLVAISETCLWCFRPDDEAQLFTRPPHVDAALFRSAFVRFGVGPAARPDPSLRAFFVLDGGRIVRFAHRLDDDEPVTLVGALAAAARTMLSRPPPDPARSPGWSRREFVVTSLIAGFAAALAEGCAPGRPPRTAAATAPVDVDVALDINGQVRKLRIEPRVSLLDALREQLGLNGTKKGCDHGQCGACTVLVDGRRVNACLTLAVMAEGAKITTIEGLAAGETLHPMQAAFIAEDALQCGYCTPGQIISAVGLLAEGHARSDDEIRELMSGNICRCGAYPNIVAAIRRVRKEEAG